MVYNKEFLVIMHETCLHTPILTTIDNSSYLDATQSLKTHKILNENTRHVLRHISSKFRGQRITST